MSEPTRPLSLGQNGRNAQMDLLYALIYRTSINYYIEIIFLSFVEQQFPININDLISNNFYTQQLILVQSIKQSSIFHSKYMQAVNREKTSQFQSNNR